MTMPISWACLGRGAVIFLLTVGCAATAAAQPSPWPFDRPPIEQLRASPRKVVSNYHCPFPLSINNRAEEEDYYTRAWLTPNGERGMHRASGGYMRQRPYPITPAAGGTLEWMTAHAEQDVRWAVAMGMDAFIVNFVGDEGSPHYLKALAVLEAARRVDPGFKIILSPDCACQWKVREVKPFLDFLRRLKDHPSLYRKDGKMVLAPWGAERHPPEFWREVLSAAKAEGMEIAFFPCPHGTPGWLEPIAPLCVGMMDSAKCVTYASTQSPYTRENIARIHALGLPYAHTVRPQDGRPKALCYWEAANSRLLRASWDLAIQHGRPDDWVQLFTWNDHGEFSGVMPANGVQYAYYDLSAYYTTWFKTGRQPPIVRDVLYYFHRVHSTRAQPDLKYQPGGKWKCVSKDPVDEIELVAFLKEPGTLQITVGGQTHTREAGAGITSFTIPLVEGTPEFRLIRGGRTLIRTRSRWTISDTILWENLMYYAGSSSREPNLAALPPEPDGVRLDLRCNETWGPYLYDASGGKHHGLLSDFDHITHVSGREGNGLHFAAPNTGERFVSVADHPALRPNRLTVSAWVRADNPGAAMLLAKEDPEKREGYSLRVSEGHLRFRVGDGTRTLEAAAPLKLAKDQWRHVAGAFDGQSLTLYVDGKRVHSLPAGRFSLRHASTDARLGAGLEGWIDEVRLYDRALTPAEVARVCAGGAS